MRTTNGSVIGTMTRIHFPTPAENQEAAETTPNLSESSSLEAKLIKRLAVDPQCGGGLGFVPTDIRPLYNQDPSVEGGTLCKRHETALSL